MKLINQSIQIWNQNDVTYSQHIERCGRVCYQSDCLGDVGFVNRIMKSGHTSVIEHYWVGLLIPNTESSALLTNLSEAKYLHIGYRNERHLMVYGNLRGWLDFVYANPFSYTLRTTLCSMYPLIFKGDSTGDVYSVAQLSGDCEPITVKIITDRGIATQLTRHRPLGFCLSGDTKILRYNQSKKHLTIKELYVRQQDNQLIGRNKLMLLRSINEDKIIIPNKFKTIIYSGIKPVYNVTTKLGYNIKTTKDHIFFTPTGECKLDDLTEGDKVLVNGTSLVKDKEWLREQCKQGVQVRDIATKAGVSYSNVGKYIREFGITRPVVDRSKFPKPWNKGITEDMDPRVKTQGDALRKHHHNNGYRAKNSAWDHTGNLTTKGFRNRFSKYPKISCEFCGDMERLENHHKDKDIKNWHESNKITLCIPCHNLIHNGFNVKKVIPDEIVSITYVGEEETYDIEMYAPFHNFVANGFVVHNSQESSRFCNYSKDKFSSHISIVQPVDWDDISKHEQDKLIDLLHRIESYYMTSTRKAEDKREILPLGLKTELIMTGTRLMWRDVYKQRKDAPAQPKIREIMKMINDEINIA